MRLRSFLFSFHGRINRLRFWLYVALAIPFTMGLMLVFWAYALSIPGAYENGGPTPLPSNPAGIAGAIVWGALLIGAFVAGLAVTVKRLHDRDKSWWWIAVFVFVPNILSSYAQSRIAALGGANAGGLAIACLVIALALFCWAIVELGCCKGTSGDNRFGPDPLF